MNKSNLTADKLSALITPYSKIISLCYLHKDIINSFSSLKKKISLLDKLQLYLLYKNISGTQDAVRVVKRVKLVKNNSTWWNDGMSCLLLLLNWNDTDLEAFHNFCHRELKVHSSVLLEPLLLFNGICRTSLGWNFLRNVRIQLFTMQGLMIIFFILQSFTFYVFPTFLDNKQLIQMAHGIFTVTFLLMYFFLSFNFACFYKNPIKLAKTVNSNQNA